MKVPEKLHFEKVSVGTYNATGLIDVRDIVIELTEEQKHKLKKNLQGEDYYINVRKSYKD